MKSFPKSFGFVLLAVLLASSVLIAQDIPLTNWTVPPYHAASSGGITTMTDITNGAAFVGAAPCRLVDTRQAGFPAGYGTPALVAGVPRNFGLRTDPLCAGFPTGLVAYSLNITATSTLGPGFILIFPQGGAQPPVSTLNYGGAGQTVANAAIVPAGTGGGVTVIAGVSGTDLIIDINGYFVEGYNNNNAFLQVGNIPGNGVGIFANGANTNNSAGVVAFVGPSFTDNVCCGPGGVIGRGAFNGVAGVAQNRATVGVLVTTAGGNFAEGQLGVAGAANQAFGVNGFTFANANADDSAAVNGNAFATTGRVYGGRFFTQSANGGAAGVIGFASEGVFAGIGIRKTAGVIGMASTHIGVKGVASNGAGEGVDGFMTDSTGASLSTGLLGYTATIGVESFGDISKSGTVSFAEPHPTDATKMLKYIALEGNEAGTYFRGRAKFQNGIATIDVPEDFRFVTQPEGLSIQVTPIGDMASVAVAQIGLDRIVVKGSRNVEFFYTVNGVRRGYGSFTPIVDTDKTYIPQSADAQMPRVWDGEIRNRLIANGTYKSDGTVNMDTAQRLGWDRVWAERERPTPQPEAPNP